MQISTWPHESPLSDGLPECYLAIATGHNASVCPTRAHVMPHRSSLLSLCFPMENINSMISLISC